MADLVHRRLFARHLAVTMAVENILALIAAGPGIYGCICYIRRTFNARNFAEWVKETHQEEWNNLHWIARRNPRAGIEVLISKGLISGPEIEAFREQDEYLEKAVWIGLIISAVLVSAIIAWKIAVNIPV